MRSIFTGAKKMWRSKTPQRALARLVFYCARATEGGEVYTNLLRLQKNIVSKKNDFKICLKSMVFQQLFLFKNSFSASSLGEVIFAFIVLILF
jgi:hypothetical protein